MSIPPINTTSTMTAGSRIIGLKLQTPFVIDNRVELLCLLRHARIERDRVVGDITKIHKGGSCHGSAQAELASLDSDLHQLDLLIARMWVSNNTG